MFHVKKFFSCISPLYIKHLGMIIILLRKDMILEIYAITVYGFL